jgi:hypothetical protein
MMVQVKKDCPKFSVRLRGIEQETESDDRYRIPGSMTESNNAPADPHTGLCKNCCHARRIENDRGSIFIMCKLSFEDSRFVKYPRLPVLVCSGYRPVARDADQL